jgi:hypothetical protein
MRRWTKLALALVAFLVVAQLVPVARTNPPVESDVPAPAEVKTILRRACYDCHSNETTWPWYSRVAPISWLVVRDVNHGREHVNFSEWNRQDAMERRETFDHIREQVETGEMPLWIYRPLHPEARLSDADKAAIQAWTRSGR